MRTKSLLVPGSMVLLAGTLTVWTLVDPKPADRSEAGAAAGDQLPLAFPAVSDAGWQLGTSYVHDVKLRMNLTGHGINPTKLEVGGRWKTTVVRSTATERDLEVAFEPVAAAPAPGFQAPDDLALYRQTFVARYEATGRVKELIFARTPTSDVTGILRELVTTFQLSVPPGHVKQWSATELDPAGEVAVEYQRSSRHDYQRNKLRYVRVGGSDGLHPPDRHRTAPKILSGKSQYRLDGDGRIQEVSARQVASVKHMNMGYDLDTETTFRFVSRGREAVARPVSVEPRPLAANVEQADFAQAQRQAWKNTVKGRTASSLMTDLKTARKSGDRKETAQSIHRLGTLMRLDDKATEAVAREIRNGTVDPGVFTALGGAGTPLAQATLMDAVKQPHLHPDDRLKAVHAVHAVTEPTPETITAVETMAASHPDAQIKKDASFARGTMIARVAKLNPASARDKVLQLAAEWDPNATSEEKRRVLRSLGNTANEAALPTLKLGLADKDPVARESAARALHKIPGPEVEQLLSAVIVSKDIDVVRYGALAACPGRKFSLLAAAFQTVLKNDDDGQVRTRILQALETFLVSDPYNKEVLQMVESVAKGNPDEDIRANAAQVLKDTAEIVATDKGDA